MSTLHYTNNVKENFDISKQLKFNGIQLPNGSIKNRKDPRHR